MSPERKSEYAQLQFGPATPPPPCPFLPDKSAPCWKKGGVCSLRLYEKNPDGLVSVDSERGTLRATCPSRFEQESTIYSWISEVLLGDAKAVPIGQVNFLERMPLMAPPKGERSSRSVEDVGRIDNVLVVEGSEPLNWCPVEIQAV
jgi:hypothetical protein